MTAEASPATDILEPIVPVAESPAPAVEPTSDATPPSSSADTTDAKPEAPKSLLDVIRDVVKPAPKEPAAPSATSSQEAEKPADAPKAKDGEAQPEAEVPFHNHPRWKQMIAERDELRPQAESFRKITQFMQASSLTGPEVDEGFQIMAKLKSGDPVVLGEAREWFAERLKALDQHLGHTLPADLQTKVTDGLVDEDVAKELARTRANAAMLESQNAARQAQTVQERQTQEAQAATLAMAEAVNGWEAQTKATDPDYATKAPMVEAQARAIVQRTQRPPRTAEEGIALAQAAYAEVNRLLKPLAPKPRPITPPPTGVSARVSAAPKTLAEAVRLAIKK